MELTSVRTHSRVNKQLMKRYSKSHGDVLPFLEETDNLWLLTQIPITRKNIPLISVAVFCVVTCTQKFPRVVKTEAPLSINPGGKLADI